jgi:hypothetical protein
MSLINPWQHVVIGMNTEGVYVYNYNAFQWVYQTHNHTTNKIVIPYIYIFVTILRQCVLLKNHVKSQQNVVLYVVTPFYTVMLCYDVTIGPHPLIGQFHFLIIW